MTEGWEQLRQNTHQRIFEATKRSNKVWTELVHGEPHYFDRIYEGNSISKLQIQVATYVFD